MIALKIVTKFFAQLCFLVNLLFAETDGIFEARNFDSTSICPLKTGPPTTGPPTTCPPTIGPQLLIPDNWPPCK